jgi:hypothetical protein
MISKVALSDCHYPKEHPVGVKVRFRSAYIQLCRTPNPTTSLILSSLYMLSLTVATTIARACSSLACESMQLKENITGSLDIVSSAHDARTPGEYLASVQWDVKTFRRFEHRILRAHLSFYRKLSPSSHVLSSEHSLDRHFGLRNGTLHVDCRSGRNL